MKNLRDLPPEISDVVFKYIISSAECSRDDHEWLSKLVQLFLPFSQARRVMHEYSRRCIERTMDEKELLEYDVLRTGCRSYGTWWMYDHCLIRRSPEDHFGWLYIRLSPWGLPTILHITWFVGVYPPGHAAELQLHTSATSSRRVNYKASVRLVHYKENHVTIAQAKEFSMSVPDENVSMDDMMKRVELASKQNAWHKYEYETHQGDFGFYASSDQINMLVALTREKVNADGILIKAATSADESVRTLEKHQLAPDEYLFFNSRDTWDTHDEAA